ncbi:type ISP restriction/modification enzyme [Bernardetia litoralis]|uniref:type ISP restriction/modification enzyme n=1 Tax=Bernardetia litoralis TaxID=999 RepID=UPI0002F4ED48|nr:type ISP restriction/modification enzyme [Bernardetia litoralis]
MKKAKIYYYNFPTFKNKDEKLAKVKQTKFANIPFELIKPDKNANWINQTDNDFDDLLPLCSKDVKLGRSEEAVFQLYSFGVSTNRDEWVYDFDVETLKKKANFFIDKYNSLLNQKKKNYDKSIKWSETLKTYFNKNIKLEKGNTEIIKSHYRPFSKKYFYANRYLSDRLTQNHFDIFGEDLQQKNKIITIHNHIQLFDFTLFSLNVIPDAGFSGRGTPVISLYRYTTEGKQIDNITQWALNEFRSHYSVGSHRRASNDDDTKPHDGVAVRELEREDIFHYVYGVLHNPAYRKKYELNLKREFPRIPFYKDFWFWSEKGKELMELHLDYEKIEKYDLEREEKPLKSGSLNKAKLKAKKEEGIIVLDEKTTLKNIPAAAWDYKLGNRSALEWILDQYKEKKPRDETIREKFNTYKFEDYKEEVIELLERVCTVSVKTMEIVGEMKGRE